MNGNFKYTISDEARDILHANLTGKETKKLASRKDIALMFQGCMDALTERVILGEPVLNTGQTKDLVVAANTEQDVHFGLGPVTPAERETINRMFREGHENSYVVGWIKGGRGGAKSN